ncbi:MAG: TRAP transporter small permease subunit [Pseudomonadota bacterium]
MTRMLLKILGYVAAPINWISVVVGRLSAWLVVMLVLLVCYDVAMRYFFQSGSIALQELEWHLFALIFLLGSAYTLKHDEHVRVDIFYQAHWMTDKRRALVDIFGCLFMLFPFCALMIYSALPFVAQSYGWAETSPDPGGLSYRWLLKAMIPFGFALLMLQGVAMVVRCLHILCDSGEQR